MADVWYCTPGAEWVKANANDAIPDDAWVRDTTEDGGLGLDHLQIPDWAEDHARRSIRFAKEFAHRPKVKGEYV